MTTSALKQFAELSLFCEYEIILSLFNNFMYLINEHYNVSNQCCHSFSIAFAKAVINLLMHAKSSLFHPTFKLFVDILILYHAKEY